jgi:hypothetical protein
MGSMSGPEMIVAALLEVQALLIAWAIYPKIFRRGSQRS